ncbi:SDR family oxidoreductase [Brachybacterium paraconglomeratum]|uniref:SDR family oxidoreductase n=1 Tax=Brachybacterium paraconglomeratum TaxID=173362 RepID=UPI003879BAB3
MDGRATKPYPAERPEPRPSGCSQGNGDALTNGLAIEVAPRGIRVIGVAPGTVDTQVHADAGEPGRPERIARMHPMGRVGRPEEIASVIAFALSADAGYVAGTTIRAAGGV